MRLVEIEVNIADRPSKKEAHPWAIPVFGIHVEHETISITS